MQKIASEFLKAKNPLVLTGAGLSTDSGIPDYRGEKGAYVVNKKFIPITFQHFMASELNRKRYWVRSYLGWHRISAAKPNDSHFNITRLEYLGAKTITQNVDGIAQKAGSSPLELHGTLHQVKCQTCKSIEPRTSFQNRLLQSNPILDTKRDELPVNPDGDAQIELNSFDFLEIPSCIKCGGILKPKVVFFGETLDIKTRETADSLLEKADFLLIIGSTLTTYSAFRFLQTIKEKGHFAASINLGAIRQDTLLNVKCNMPMSKALPTLLHTITSKL